MSPRRIVSLLHNFCTFLLIALVLFPPTAFADCSTRVVWSKGSPNQSIVYEHRGDQTRILVCKLRMVESKDAAGHLSLTRRFANCDPINPDEPAYADAELKADTTYLIGEKRWSKFKEVGQDITIAFFVSLGFARLGQALAVSSASVASAGGKLAARLGEKARCAAHFMDLTLGFGKEGIVEGARVVAADRFVRFYPAYVGTGVGIGTAIVNEIRHGDYRRDQTMARSLDPDSTGGKDCGPIEVETKIDDYSNLIRDALRLARAHRLELLLQEDLKPDPQNKEWLRKRALETAPTGLPPSAPK